ncbi:transporter substrate-binding domain-containing protein [Nitrospirillum bahiense]|uniref:Amino acid ABC transporter substrate-binding protein (PAAT family) n=1 Tax=Nitrospirillum amazonense TaxID=28077 RepID=A0A560FQH2_9PROT|nr:transporter substrate-binding domain-containing protein [Nitrospirillum amazonense]TWB23862.1 amino acid ABC transporter substrate-binding protein (PAAT family) [Nitrospirillum amazonense]
MKKLVLGLIAVAVVAGAAYLATHRTPSGTGAPTVTDQGVPNPLRVATEGAYPPFNVAEPDGTLKGFEIDLAKDLCRRLGVKCEIAAQAWDGIIPGLQAGKYDVILAGMSVTEDRRQAVDFTVPYVVTPAYFVAPKDSPLTKIDFGLQRLDISNMDEASTQAMDKLKAALKGKTVGVQVATIHANFLDTYLGDTVTIRRYDTLQNLSLDLATGRVDAGLADMTGWQPFLEGTDGQNAATFGPGITGGLLGPGIAAALRKGDGRLLDALNNAITAAKEDGTMKKLAEQWFHFDASAK